MSDIFISYATEDRKSAQRLAQHLAHLGWSVWWDRKIPPGKAFDDVIEHELSKCRCVVVLWSKTSVKKRWVKLEARGGNNRGVLIPVLIDKVNPPFEFSDVQAASMYDWDGSYSHAGFKLLASVIQERTGRRAQQVPSSTRHPDSRASPQKEARLATKKPLPNWKIISISVGVFVVLLAVILVNYLTPASESVPQNVPLNNTVSKIQATQRTYPVKIISYNSTFEVYRNDIKIGVTSPSRPLEFRDVRGPLELECKINDQRKPLQIFVGAKPVWACQL